MQASSKKRKIWFDNFKYHHISISISFMTSFSYMRWHSTFVISDNWQWEKKFSNSLLGLFKRYCWLMRHFLYLGVEKQTFSGSHSGLFKRYFWLLSHLRWLTVEKKRCVHSHSDLFKRYYWLKCSICIFSWNNNWISQGCCVASEDDSTLQFSEFQTP